MVRGLRTNRTSQNRYFGRYCEIFGHAEILRRFGCRILIPLPQLPAKPYPLGDNPHVAFCAPSSSPPPGRSAEEPAALAHRPLPLPRPRRCALHGAGGTTSFPLTTASRTGVVAQGSAQSARLLHQPRARRAHGVGQDDALRDPECAAGGGFGGGHRPGRGNLCADLGASAPARLPHPGTLPRRPRARRALQSARLRGSRRSCGSSRPCWE